MFENCASDTKVTGADDTSVADIFTLLPDWIDALRGSLALGVEGKLNTQCCQDSDQPSS